MTNDNLHIFDRAGMDVAYIWSKVRQIRREYSGQKRILGGDRLSAANRGRSKI